MRENETSKCPRPQNVQAWRIPESSKQFWNSWSKENASICFHIPMALVPFVWPTRPAVPASSGENPMSIPDQGHAMHCTWFGWNSAPQTNLSTLDWWMYLGGIGNRRTIAFAPQTTAKPTSTTPLHQSDLVPGPGMSSPSPLSGGLSSTIKTGGNTREEQAPLGLRWLEHYARSNATGSGLLRLGTDYRLASFSNQRKSRWHPVHKAKHKLIIESWMAPDFVPSWGATPLLTSEHSAAKTVDAKSRINRWQLTCIARSHQFEVLEMYSTTK